MMRYVTYFMGTPERLLRSMVACLVVFGLVRPEVIGHAVQNLLSALLTAIAPSVEPVLTLAIVIAGMGIIVKKAWR